MVASRSFTERAAEVIIRHVGATKADAIVSELRTLGHGSISVRTTLARLGEEIKKQREA